MTPKPRGAKSASPWCGALKKAQAIQRELARPKEEDVVEDELKGTGGGSHCFCVSFRTDCRGGGGGQAVGVGLR